MVTKPVWLPSEILKICFYKIKNKFDARWLHCTKHDAKRIPGSEDIRYQSLATIWLPFGYHSHYHVGYHSSYHFGVTILVIILRSASSEHLYGSNKQSKKFPHVELTLIILLDVPDCRLLNDIFLPNVARYDRKVGTLVTKFLVKTIPPTLFMDLYGSNLLT